MAIRHAVAKAVLILVIKNVSNNSTYCCGVVGVAFLWLGFLIAQLPEYRYVSATFWVSSVMGASFPPIRR